MAARVEATKPASLRVSVWMAAWIPDSSHTRRQASMAAGVEPQSSWSLKPATPERTCSHNDSADTVFPLPSRATLTGQPSSDSNIRARFHGPGVTVVALVPSAGPVPPPTTVVIPVDKASSRTCGQIRWTWQSTAPAVRIIPLPARISVPGPMARSGCTPSITSGLPALPRAEIRPSLMPRSHFTMPQWSSTTAPVITRSGEPDADVDPPWPIDSRITLPPPKTASSPERPGPPQRSSSTSISRSVSARRILSPVVGPNRSL